MRRRPKIVKRQKEVKLRKNFLVTFIITLLLWLGVSGIVYFIDPYENGATALFFLILFFALFFTFSIIFINSRRGFIMSIGLTTFVGLRYFGLGNVLNFLLITGICVAIELYFSNR